MNQTTRATLAATLALTCLDGRAKVNDRCVVLVEARPVAVAATPRPACPYVIDYRPQALNAAASRQAARPVERPSHDRSSPAANV